MEVFILIIKWYNCSQSKLHLNKQLTFIDSSTCNVFGTCSVDNPSFVVDSVKGNYVSYNNKCYFVDDQIYSNGKWIIKCSYDDLANSHNEIENIFALIVRNEEGKFSDIPDSTITFESSRDIKRIKLTGGIPLGNTGDSTRSLVLTVNS